MRTQRQQDDVQGFRSFEFDLPSALLEQLVALLDAMEQGSLLPDVTSAVPNAQGVYQLFHNTKLVYVGKTDAEAGLKQRLSRHAWTIQSRHNLDVQEMTFKAVEVLVFSAMDLEKALISHYKRRKEHPAWNGSGFGSNDPGRRRDKTALKEDGFDANYPINIDLPLETPPSGQLTALDALTRLMPSVPYTLRHERSDEALAELERALLSLPDDKYTLRFAIEAICAVLPIGWQATKLPARVIAYRELVDDYPGGEIIARSQETQ
ncbi:MAG TPA: Eco29kI family restriction endonuclease [Allosphingosinicella sp.]|nr:Eco29kI family restriction endonuclease [Allosphingosinicella sp.]